MRALFFAPLVLACVKAAPATVDVAPDTQVDERCLARARDGSLLGALPAEVMGFGVAVTGPRDVTLRRAGRELTEDEGKRLWNPAPTFSGMTFGHSALFSIEKCPDTKDTSCLSYGVQLCQTSLSTIAAAMDAALTRVGAADGALTVRLSIVEVGGPACKDGPRCAPKPHYSTPHGQHDEGAERHVLPDWKAGACRDDGDCEGGGNSCHAWYLRGGAELAIYVQRPEPAFCGCVERRCTWFTQE